MEGRKQVGWGRRGREKESVAVITQLWDGKWPLVILCLSEAKYSGHL